MVNYQHKNNMSFKAQFPKRDIELLIKEQEDAVANLWKNYKIRSIPDYPKLYTFLERIAEIKEGTTARLKLGNSQGGGWATPKAYPRIEIDGELLMENIGGDRGKYWYDTLEKAVLGGSENNFGIPYFFMPRSVYEQTWWKHRNVTADDIRKLAIDA